MVQSLQNVRSTKLNKTEAEIVKQQFKQQFTGAGYGAKTRSDKLPDTEKPSPGNESVNELHVKVLYQSKLYTDNTGRFPTKAQSGNQYAMVAYHLSNVILFEPFASRKDKHRLSAYNVIMQRLKYKNILVDLQILNNECSKEYKANMKQKWDFTYQLVPPDLHIRNAAKRVIRTVKAHFLAILAGVATDFLRYLWNLFLPQTELTLNLLCQSTADPNISAWEFFSGLFNYNSTPLVPLRICVISHDK